MASITLNMAKQNMTSAGVPMATLAIICGVRPSTLSSAYRGAMSLHSIIEADLLSKSGHILKIVRNLDPLRPPDDANEFGRLVAQLEDGHISLEDIRAAVKRLFGQ